MNVSRIPLPKGRERRREMERWLADCGLLRRPRRLFGGTDDATGEESFVRRLRRALEGLGPLFQLFGRYLSTRADLLPARDCLELAEIPGQAPAPPDLAPAPPWAVRDQIASELGRSPEELFSAFDEVPRKVRLLDSSYHAHLATGEPVIVRVMHPHLEEEVERDLEMLPWLGPVFQAAELPGGGMPFEEVIADFQRSLAARLDFTAEAAALESLARDAVDSDLLVVPELYPSLTTPKVLTLARLDGTDFGEIARRGGEAHTYNLARRLFLMWLQQALVVRMFPIEAELLELHDGRLALTGGEFVVLPAASQPNLWEYLRTTAAHHPDEACGCLLQELTGKTKTATEDNLRLRMRQLVPFRDGSWSERGDTVAEHLILHWRLIRECGFRPRSHLLAFYQGLFWAARISQRLAPRADPLREAQEDLRWLASWNQFRQLADPRRMGESLEENLASLLELPQKLDQVLSLATGEGGRLRLRVEESATSRRIKDSSVAVIALALVMAVLVLVAMELPTLGFEESAVQRIGAAAFLLVGGALLWVVKRS